MTREELTAWAARHGLTVLPTVRYYAMCAQVAEIAAADLEAEWAALAGS